MIFAAVTIVVGWLMCVASACSSGGLEPIVVHVVIDQDGDQDRRHEVCSRPRLSSWVVAGATVELLGLIVEATALLST